MVCDLVRDEKGWVLERFGLKIVRPYLFRVGLKFFKISILVIFFCCREL